MSKRNEVGGSNQNLHWVAGCPSACEGKPTITRGLFKQSQALMKTAVTLRGWYTCVHIHTPTHPHRAKLLIKQVQTSLLICHVTFSQILFLLTHGL